MGRNLQIDSRWAGGDPDKARTLAKELIIMRPDVIVPNTNQVTQIVQQETRTIPEMANGRFGQGTWLNMLLAGVGSE